MPNDHFLCMSWRKLRNRYHLRTHYLKLLKMKQELWQSEICLTAMRRVRDMVIRPSPSGQPSGPPTQGLAWSG